MNLSNKVAANLLKKDKNISNQAAREIIDNKDIDAWVCLVEEGKYVFDFIKSFASKKLLNACNQNNVLNLFDFMKYHSPDWDDFVAEALVRFCDDEIIERCLELLDEGTKQEKAYCAKFFAYMPNEGANELLFENSKSSYSSLADNCAIALGESKDPLSYEYYLGLLSSDDDWEKLKGAQFLSLYNDKKATLPILEAMHNSAMSEHIAGELASFQKLSELIDSEDDKIKSLSLECLDNIISGLVEIWPLSVLFDFEIKYCMEMLLELVQRNDKYTGQYSQILLKTKNSLRLFNENSEYQYDEDKNTLNELNDIYRMLVSCGDDFWEAQVDNLINELDNPCSKRQLSAINLIAVLKIDCALPCLLDKLNTENETLLCEVIIAISQLEGISKINDKQGLLDKIKDPNLSAIVENIFFTVA